MTPPVIHQAVPMLGVRDINELLAFYTDGIGFETGKTWMLNGAVRWCRLQHGETAVMLQAFHPVDQPGEGHLGAGMTIYFQCDDALAFYRRLMSRGIVMRRPFVGNGLWEVHLRDPDGYRLAFTSPANEAEGVIYDESLHG